MFSLRKKTSCLILVCIISCFVLNNSAFGVGENFTVYGGPTTWGFYDTGYSDGWYWGYSEDEHPHGNHEMLSGEFAAAIWWPNCGSNEAIWLTDWFECPSFSTNTIFQSYGNPPYLTWNDTNNPVNSVDTAYAVIRDSLYGQNSIEIKMDFEVVDLAFGDPNNTARSPLSFIIDNGTEYVNSERYVLLMTYTFRNISDSNTITGLEFYQMLHGHPADSYGENIYSSYSTVSYSDVLANYTPYNSVHQIGNFRYDITQWNGPTYQGDTHIDYMSFSSAVEPDVIDNDVFEGHGSSAPTTGTYVNIMNRDLNSQDTSNGQVAGAMGWYLPELDPNETTSITLAIMFGYGETCSSGLWVDKSNNIDPNGLACINPASSDPNDYKVVYTIDYGNDGNDIAYNCVLTDTLPEEIDRFSGEVSDGGTYSWLTNIATWQIGTLNPSDSDSVTLTVYASSAVAEPGGEITNEVVLSSDMGWVKDVDLAPVCCYDNITIFVNAYATGAGTVRVAKCLYRLARRFRPARECGAMKYGLLAAFISPTGKQAINRGFLNWLTEYLSMAGLMARKAQKRIGTLSKTRPF
jgi:uncharacterized repeat protein (TIGR01451 family)